MLNNNFSKRVQHAMGEAASTELTGGYWNKKGPYKHIYLDKKYNFIDGIVPNECDLKGTLFGRKIKYHQGASHLNSSQVMCINYFKKFFEQEEKEQLLLEILKKAGIDFVEGEKIINAIFEFEPDEKEKTNFDFYLILESGKRVSFEIKFTEAEFGGISEKDETDKYKQKWEITYASKVANSKYLSGKCDRETFYKNYQINRNIIYAEREDVVIFLTPKANDAKGMVKGRKYIDGFGVPNIINLYWENIITWTLEVVKDNEELVKYYNQFKMKYIDIL